MVGRTNTDEKAISRTGCDPVKDAAPDVAEEGTEAGTAADICLLYPKRLER